jgi:hypothetical protein
MRRVRALATIALAGILLTGCAQQETSAGDFKGAEADVAEVVDDLAGAARSGDGDEICTRIVSSEFAEELAAGNTCKDEVERAVADANDWDLEVSDVTVTGTTATAEVRQGEDSEEKTATFEFERDGDRWRATSFGES